MVDFNVIPHLLGNTTRENLTSVCILISIISDLPTIAPQFVAECLAFVNMGQNNSSDISAERGGRKPTIVGCS